MDYIAAERFFKDYLNDYDLSNGSIVFKIKHTFEVVRLIEYIARGLDLSDEDIELAKIIALLHDLGRFEQIKVNGIFDNSKLEHAQYGVEVLFERGLIRKFISDGKYDRIIEKAIYNHNKYEIEKGLSERELLFAQMIRDADKLDVYRVYLETEFKDLFVQFYDPKRSIGDESINPVILEDFMNHRCARITDRKNIIDCFVCAMAFIYDLNFDISLQYVYNNNIIDKMIDRIGKVNDGTRVQIDNIKECGNDYVKNKLGI